MQTIFKRLLLAIFGIFTLLSAVYSVEMKDQELIAGDSASGDDGVGVPDKGEKLEVVNHQDVQSRVKRQCDDSPCKCGLWGAFCNWTVRCCEEYGLTCNHNWNKCVYRPRSNSLDYFLGGDGGIRQFFCQNGHCSGGKK